MRPAWESGAGFSALAIIGLLALNYPLLSLFDRDAMVFGIPLPFLHVLVVWALLIAGLAALVERRSQPGVRRNAPNSAFAGRSARTRQDHTGNDDSVDTDSASDIETPATGQRHPMDD
ncbi:hypothetical protein ACUNV4_09255 [Granulosicoccus sp. 3-233]|uniref:hypothetical protein n=1 Tax=Granulosicoccus sp. 3-233 TaxID=3417969 RepID=UPI003D32FCA9